MIITKEHLIMAIHLVTYFFNGQVAKDGTPSILHSLSVLIKVSRAFPENCRLYYTLCVIAVLHDILEDTDIKEETLKLYFGDEVTRYIKILTKRENDKYEDYSRYVLESRSVSTIVKYFDMQDNLERCKFLVGQEADCLKNKYINGIKHFKENGIDKLIEKAINYQL